MYIGPMDVTHEQNGDTVKVNGSLYTSKYYAETKDLYFRLRARRIPLTQKQNMAVPQFIFRGIVQAD